MSKAAFRALLERAEGHADAAFPGEAHRPLVVETIPPSGFADTWKNRPHAPVQIGLRLVGEDIIAHAQANAMEFAREYHPTIENDVDRDVRIEAYNAALMREILVHACCSPTDVDEPFFKETPQDTFRAALRDVTVRRLWEAYERLSRSTSPLTAEASDDDVTSLATTLLVTDLLEHVEPAEQARLRRLLTFVRESLAAAGVDVIEAPTE